VFKNVAGQKLNVFAFDSTTNLPKTGDAANITAYVSKDFGAVTVLGDTTATEADATNAKGYYIFDLTQAETNGDTLTFSAKSSTANIVVIAVPATVYTLPPNFTGLTVAGGKVASTLAAADVSGNLPANVIQWLSAAAPANTGDAFARIGANGAGLTAIPDEAGVTTLLARLTALRAGYIDNLSAGPVATHNDIDALNQSASRRILLITSPQYERPESGNNTYQIEARTYDGDGAAVNADSTPTLTATGLVSGSLAANLSAATNPSTGVYRWTYTVASTAVLQQVRFDVSALISASTFTLSTFTQVADFVAATWTTADRTLLTNINTRVLLSLPAFSAGSLGGLPTIGNNIPEQFPGEQGGLMILGFNDTSIFEWNSGTALPSLKLSNDSIGFIEGNIVGNIQGSIDVVIGNILGDVVGKILGGGGGTIGGVGVWASGTTGGTLPSTAAVWDLLTAGHTTPGTFGAAMSAAGSAGDPWITNLPGSYVAGQAGNILGTLAGGGGGATASEIVDAIKTFEVETGHSFLQVMQYVASFIIGLTNRDVGDNTLSFRNLLNSFDRIKFKLDKDNNRVESTVNQS
jgi:hypothetical protein